jgi:hypothetical protein
MDNKLKPAVIGGVLLGICSALPFIQILNTCCCLWALLGGATAVYFYIKNSSRPINMGEGAMLGAMAGLLGAVLFVVIGIPVSLVTGQAMLSMMSSITQNMGGANNQMMEEAIRAAQSQTMAEQLPGAILQHLIGAVILIIFSTIGGLIAVPILEKRKVDPTMPPPPPNFNVPPSGGYGV